MEKFPYSLLCFLLIEVDQLSEKGKKFVKTIGLTIQKFNGNLIEIITGTLRCLHGTKVQFKDC
jgi:hypothetical protein